MSLQGERTIFGRIPEKNVYFLIDTSGSMYHQLGFVKNHLIEVLTRRAVISPDTMFNIVEFREDTNKFAECLVQCTPETVNTAARWIGNLTCGTSTDTMSALLHALSDTAVEAIYLVTDGLPDQRPSVILEKLALMSSAPPVHCTYLKGTYSDPAACDFLHNLAKQTCGSLHVVKLSNHGQVEQFLPVYNSRTTDAQEYDASDLSTPKHYTGLTTHPNSNYQHSSCNMPVKQTDDNCAHKAQVLRKNSTLENSSRNGLNSNVLGYAETLNKARGLALSVGLCCSSTPLASSLMKGVKVLACLDRDGLYYLGQVKEQGTNETFVVKFERCQAMRKVAPQEISVHHMIAYKDAERLNISLGDKVLAPWQRDGRYGPGTVLDGYERRDTRNEGDDDGELLVTFFNGQTVSIPRGVALRIPEKKFDRISSDLLLPESQRRKQRFRDQLPTAASVYDSYARPGTKMVRDDERRDLQLENEKLQQKLDKQIEENNNLLHALDLSTTSTTSSRDSHVIGRATSCDLGTAIERTPTRDSVVIGRATSRDLDIANVSRHEIISPVIGRATSRDLIGDYDSGVFSDEDSEGCSEENSTDRTSPYSEISHNDVCTHDKDYDLAVNPRFSLPEEKVPSKSNGKIKPIQHWRYPGSGVPSKQPRFRETALAKPREPGEKLIERPTHEEYQTVGGVSFPVGTDRKFGAKPQKWHPYRQFGDAKRKENISAIWERKHLKHSEYQDSSGVKFPPSTDKKFTRSLDPNWSPDTALRNAERSRNWEDGLGQGGAEKNARYVHKLERIRSNKRRYFKDIEDKVAIEEGKETKRVEFRRNKMTERKEDMAEAEAEQDRVKTARLETRRAKQAEIAKHEKDRTAKAEKWKTDRIQAMKERQVKFAEIESGHEEKIESKMARRQAYLRMREHERREQFHDRLREEWRMEDEREENLRRRSEANREKQDVRKQDADRTKEARLSAKQERMEKYRASILP